MVPREFPDLNNEPTEIIEDFQQEPLPIKESHHKGDGGVLLLIGGSELYTGAPYYASKAALLTGVDLVYILACENNLGGTLAVSLKTLLPECIIIPILTFDIKKHSFILNRITSVLFGSGLGRPDTKIVNKIEEIFNFFTSSRKSPFTVVDGDGIHFLCTHKNIPIKNIIITPNYNEKKYIPLIDHDVLCVLFKASKDILMNNFLVLGINNESSRRRCGGIGDVLAGLIVSFVNHYLEPFEAVKTASLLTRELSRRVWQKYNISMSTQDILEEIKLYFTEKIVLKRE